MNPAFQDNWATVYSVDALTGASLLPEKSVHTIVTSPPYWGLRSYLPSDHPDKAMELGAESTPELYVERLVEVFRALRRVLRDDGQLWINLGDSYASSGVSGEVGSSSTFRDASRAKGVSVKKQGSMANGRAPTPPGLKPKDLVGIPWAVAEALRDPYYLGDIKKETDRVWLAAIIDGEGSISGFEHLRKDDGRVRTGVNMCITNTCQLMLDRATEIWPASRYEHMNALREHYGTREVFRWAPSGSEKKSQLLAELYPYFVSKKKQALVAWNLLEFVKDGRKLGKSRAAQEVRDKRGLLAGILSKLNHGKAVTLPDWLLEPPVMFGQGWYLRSDIIWSKPSPMPESVIDRPTKSHEYMFLLTKSPRYYFDQEAVRESPSNNSHGALMAGSPKQQSINGASDKNNLGLCTSSRNIRSVWNIATRPYPGSHYATMPVDLVYPCIKAGTSERGVCEACGAPWERVVERTAEEQTNSKGSYFDRGKTGSRDGGDRTQEGERFTSRTVGWQPTCSCNGEYIKEPYEVSVTNKKTGKQETVTRYRSVYVPGIPLSEHPVIPATVLDPFMGSGTTALAARKFGRRSIGFDLDERNLPQIEERLGPQGVFL